MKSTFSKSDDNIIAKYCNIYQKNLQEGFVIIANKLGRLPKTIQGRWYSKVRYTHPNTFVTTSGKEHLDNTKIIQRRKPRPDMTSTGVITNITFRF